VDKTEAMDYLRNIGLEKEAPKIYELVGGRMAHFVAAWNYYEISGVVNPFEGMSVYIGSRNRTDRFLFS
jgi:hypothetical protein